MDLQALVISRATGVSNLEGRLHAAKFALTRLRNLTQRGDRPAEEQDDEPSDRPGSSEARLVAIRPGFAVELAKGEQLAQSCAALAAQLRAFRWRDYAWAAGDEEPEGEAWESEDEEANELGEDELQKLVRMLQQIPNAAIDQKARNVRKTRPPKSMVTEFYGKLSKQARSPDLSERELLFWLACPPLRGPGWRLPQLTWTFTAVNAKEAEEIAYLKAAEFLRRRGLLPPLPESEYCYSPEDCQPDRQRPMLLAVEPTIEQCTMNNVSSGTPHGDGTTGVGGGGGDTVRCGTGSSSGASGQASGGSTGSPGKASAASAGCCTSCMRTGWGRLLLLQPLDLDWQAVFSQRCGDIRWKQSKQGYARFLLAEGLVGMVAETMEEAEAATHDLLASMGDPVLALAMEAAPKGNTYQLGMMQQQRSPLLSLATSSRVLLLRLPPPPPAPPAGGGAAGGGGLLGGGAGVLPASLQALLEGGGPRPCTVLTWGWSASQDLRFRRAFGLGRQQMRHMFDMQEVVGWMGFDQRSLDTTAQRLLHPSFSRDKPPPSAADSCYWSEQPGQLSDAQVKQAALEAIVTGELCRLLHAWHTCRLPARPCPACAFPYGGFITLPHLYVCAHPGCDTSVFSGLAEYEKHCKGTRHALRFRTARCSECGRTVFDKTPLQQQPAAASDGAGAISDDRGGGGWDDGDGEYGDAADLYGSSGRRPAMGGPGRGGAMGGPGRGSARFGSAMGVPGRGRFGAMGGPGRGSGRFSAMAGPGRADKGGSIRQCDVVKTVASGDEYDNSSWV